MLNFHHLSIIHQASYILWPLICSLSAMGPSVQIDKPILLFGRHEECDVQLNSKKVSRRHCVRGAGERLR